MRPLPEQCCPVQMLVRILPGLHPVMPTYRPLADIMADAASLVAVSSADLAGLDLAGIAALDITQQENNKQAQRIHLQACARASGIGLKAG